MAKHLDAVLAQAKKLAAGIPAAIDALQAQIDELRGEQIKLNELYKATTGSAYVDLVLVGAPEKRKVKSATAPKSKPSGKRTRRSSEALKELAEQVVATIDKAKDDGISAQELKSKMPQLSGVQSVKKFIEQYAGKGRVTTKGNKRTMRYFGK